MHPQEVWEEMSVVAPEVGKELCIFVESQKLANYLDGEHFRVKERGSRPACCEASEILESVVDEAEDEEDEGAKIYKKKTSFTLVGLVATERREVFSLVQALKETCTWG